MSIRLELLPARECLVSVPISAYTGAVVPNVDTLHSRLLRLSILPHEWKCERPPDYSGHALVIFKSGYSNASLSPKIVFSLQVFMLCILTMYMVYKYFLFLVYVRYMKIIRGI